MHIILPAMLLIWGAPVDKEGYRKHMYALLSSGAGEISKNPELDPLSVLPALETLLRFENKQVERNM